MNLIKAHGGKGSGPFSFERSATSPPQADHVLVDLFSSMVDAGLRGKAPRQRNVQLCTYPHALLSSIQINAATIKLPNDPAVPLLKTDLKKAETLPRKYISTPMFLAMLFTIANIRKQLKCPSVYEWI